MSPISFSDKFVLLSLKGSQKFIETNWLIFSTLFPLYQKQIGPMCYIHIFNATKRFFRFLSQIPIFWRELENPRSTYTAKPLFWDEMRPRLCDLNLPFLIPRLVSELT